MTRIKLLTAADKKKIPPLYAQGKKGDQAVAWIKFFTPDANWAWYATEYDPIAEMFFGLVVGQEAEIGYFSLADLASIRGQFGLPVERDIHWRPATITEIRNSWLAPIHSF